jgi:hypothetical protein
MSRVVAGDSAKQRNDYLCRVDQSRSRAYANRNSPEPIGIESGSILEGEKLSQVTVRVQQVEEALLGAAFVGQRVLGCYEWECNR